MDIKRKRIMIYFIEATQKLIRTEGMDSLSIRKLRIPQAITVLRYTIIFMIWSI